MRETKDKSKEIFRVFFLRKTILSTISIIAKTDFVHQKLITGIYLLVSLGRCNTYVCWGVEGCG